MPPPAEIESPIAMYVPNFAFAPTGLPDPELDPPPELPPEEPDVDPEAPELDPELDPEDVDPEPDDDAPLEEELPGDVLEEPPHAAARAARRRALRKG